MLAIILLTSLFTYLSCPEEKSTRSARVAQVTTFKCSQLAREQDPLIREAVENQYRVRRVEFVGNERTRDNVLRQRITLQEGDVFTRENLIRSIRSVSGLKRIIHRVNPSDVILSLDRPEKIVDLTICLRERRPNKGAAKQRLPVSRVLPEAWIRKRPNEFMFVGCNTCSYPFIERRVNGVRFVIAYDPFSRKVVYLRTDDSRFITTDGYSVRKTFEVAKSELRWSGIKVFAPTTRDGWEPIVALLVAPDSYNPLADDAAPRQVLKILAMERHLRH